MFTVGPVQENCFIARRDGSNRAVIFDPGDEPERILAPVRDLGLEVEAVLLTHSPLRPCRCGRARGPRDGRSRVRE